MGYPVAEVEFMANLREKGTSYGRIGEELFDTFGYTLDPRDIRKLIQERQSKKEYERA
ncbi:MAG: hypothetical protein JSW61_15010 [Candidatus Thorarchaeota archaeon]|nr:MAG: hypothetical protein JSW61_15010 [Candidatus Thorarchaeota archaeon]